MQKLKSLCVAVMMLSAAIGTAGATSLNDGLVGHYSFNDCTSADSSGMGNNGTFIGSNQCVQGVNGNAMKFGGPYNRGYVMIPNKPSLSFLDNYTFAVWFNIQSNTSMDGWGRINDYGMHSIFAKAGDRNGLIVRTVRDPEDGLMRLLTLNGRHPYSDSYGMETSQKFDLNEWHMVTVTSGGGDVKVYFDCELQNTVPTDLFKVNTTMQYMPLQLGVDQSTWWYPIDGILDEAQVYNRALSEQDVKDLYMNAGIGVCPGTNQLPVSNAGPDRMVSCGGSYGTEVTLDGSQSSDPDGDSLTYTWTWPGGSIDGVNPVVTLPLGATTITLTVDDGKGGTAADTMMVTVKDDMPPVTTIQSYAGIVGNNDWFQSAVTVNLDAADNCSGVEEIRTIVDGGMTIVPGRSAAITLSSDGTNNFNYYAVDKAGISETPDPLTVKIDRTPPVIVASVNAMPNAAGWYSGDVTVTFTCTDAVSGVASCQSPITVTSEGAAQVITGMAVDNAGNTATASVELSIDKTPPVVSVTASHDLLWPPNHKMVRVTPSVTVTDANVGETVKLVSATSSEPDNGLGDGDTAKDIVVNADGTLSLRAERSGKGSGRVYTITYQAFDVAGNTTTASATVTVPLSR